MAQQERISSSDYDNLKANGKIANETKEDEYLLVATSTFAEGYSCGNDRNNDMTKEQAKQQYSSISNDTDFLSGYDTGKENKYLDISKEERRQYVSITTGTESDLNKEVNFYPLEELYVISSDQYNSIVRVTPSEGIADEENIRNGNYQVILGQDLQVKDCKIDDLRGFATDYPELIEDAGYIVPAGYQVIPEISPETFPTTVTKAQKSR